jgi:MFS family permease
MVMRGRLLQTTDHGRRERQLMSSATKRFHGLRTLFSKPDFRRLAVAQIFGGLGEWIATLALYAIVLDRTHSAFASGLVIVFRILPAALVGSALGSFVDRFDRRRVLVATTAGRACIYGALMFVSGVAFILALALIAEVASIAYMSARDAVVPRLVPEESLPGANAISMASSYGSMPFGTLMFAGLHWLQRQAGHPGDTLSLAVAAGMCFVATLMIGRMAAAAVPLNADGTKKQRCERGALRAVYRADPILRRVVIGGVVIACSAGSLLTLGITYVRETLHASPVAYGGLLTAFCLGAVAGVVGVQKARKHLPKLFHLAGVVMGAILVAMALFPSTPIGYAMGFVFGSAFVAVFLGGITILQDRVDENVRGRAFALAHSGLRVLAVGAGFLGALGAEMLGHGHVLGHMNGTQIMLGASGVVLLGSGALIVRRPVALLPA